MNWSRNKIPVALILVLALIGGILAFGNAAVSPPDPQPTAMDELAIVAAVDMTVMNALSNTVPTFRSDLAPPASVAASLVTEQLVVSTLTSLVVMFLMALLLYRFTGSVNVTAADVCPTGRPRSHRDCIHPACS